MNYFWILGGLGFTALALMLFHEHAYSRGKQEGEKSGYQRGFQEGHTAADNWWMNWEHEVTRTQKSIQNEERWP